MAIFLMAGIVSEGGVKISVERCRSGDGKVVDCETVVVVSGVDEEDAVGSADELRCCSGLLMNAQVCCTCCVW